MGNELTEEQLETLDKPLKRMDLDKNFDIFNNTQIFANNVLFFESELQKSKILQKDNTIYTGFITSIDEFVEYVKIKRNELKAKLDKNKAILGKK